jgi:hypothetical protein
MFCPCVWWIGRKAVIVGARAHFIRRHTLRQRLYTDTHTLSSRLSIESCHETSAERGGLTQRAGLAVGREMTSLLPGSPPGRLSFLTSTGVRLARARIAYHLPFALIDRSMVLMVLMSSGSAPQCCATEWRFPAAECSSGLPCGLCDEGLRCLVSSQWFPGG